MKVLILTDADDRSSVLILFGGGGVTFAKPVSDSNGPFTEIYNGSGEIVATVSETIMTIKNMLEQA
jgi:hypothetical protein